jgi:WD40 repeat protein
MRACLMIVMAVLVGSALAGEQGTSPPEREQPPRTDRYGDPLPKGALARIGTLRFCQPFPSSLAFSPDGKVLASGGYDSRVHLWDPDTGKDVLTLEGHKGEASCIAFSANGKLLASGSQDTELRLWEVATGKERQRFVGHNAPIERLALSPDGKVLASSCLGGTLRLWDTGTGKEIRSVPIDPGYRVLAMTFSPDSKQFAFNNRSDKGIQLVDVAGGNVVRTFQGHKDKVNELIFTPDGTKLISGSADRTIRVWDVASGKEVHRYGDEKGEVRCLALAPDGKTLTYGTHPDGMVHIWDLAANKDLVQPWKAHRWCVVSIAYSPDSKKVALGRDTIALHETATGKLLNPTTESELRPQQVEYAAAGKVLVVRRQDDSIELWDTATWRKTATLTARVGVFNSLVTAPAGDALVTIEGESKQTIVCRWDARTGNREKEPVQVKSWLSALSSTADGRTLAGLEVVGPQYNYVRWDAATGKELGRISDPERGRNPRLSPDGRLLACATYKNAAVLWDTETGKPVRKIGTGIAGGRDLIAFSPDGRTIVTGGGQGFEGRLPIQPDIVLWETATGGERLRISPNEGVVTQAAFSPDGRLLATATSRSEAIRLWDTWTGQEMGRFTGHRGAVWGLSFAPDGRTLASGGADRTLLIWDVSGVRPAKPAVEKLDRAELTRCWDSLARVDAGRAYLALAELARHPDQTEDLLKERLVSPRVKPEYVARLIGNLDSEDFETRENASKELADLGRLAEGALRKALAGNLSVEARQRIRALLAPLEGNAEDPDQRLLLRVIEVLERLGTPESRRLLDKLGKEATDPGVAREARTAAERLDRVRERTP